MEKLPIEYSGAARCGHRALPEVGDCGAPGGRALPCGTDCGTPPCEPVGADHRAARNSGTPPCKSNRPVRKRLDHRGPLSIDVSSAWYFITICAEGHRPWACDAVPTVGADHRAARDCGAPGGRALPCRTDCGTPPCEPVGADHRAARNSGTPPCKPVGADHRAARTFEELATLLLDEARFMHNAGKWFLSLMLVMPDHLHLIVHGPPGGRPLPLVIGDFKRYLTSHFGIRFQRDFFDTRIRDDAHYAENFRYICNNPVRKGLCVTARNWRHVIAFDRNTGMERQHR